MINDYNRLTEGRPLLTAEEERDLQCAINNGNEEARETLVLSNLRLVLSIANEYQIPHMFDELVSAGVVGLVEATYTYDPDIARYSTYASWQIKKNMNEMLCKMLHAVRIPPHAAGVFRKIKRAAAECRRRSIACSPENIAPLIGKSISSTRKYLRCTIDAQTSMDAIEDDSIAIETIPRKYHRCLEMPLNELLGCLDDLDLEIIKMRFGLAGDPPMTYWQIGEVVKLTHQRVHQRVQAALKRMKKVLGRQ